VGMPPPHFLFQRARDRLRVELAPLFPDDDLKREVQQQVAQLVAQCVGIVPAQRLVELECLFNEVRAERGASLRAVPGTAGAQVADQREGASQGGVARGGPG